MSLSIRERAEIYAIYYDDEEYECLNRDEYDAYIQGATDQQKIDIEDRFGSINHIQNVLKSIISNTETMTSGNVAHHRASIKLLAEGLLNYIKAIEE